MDDKVALNHVDSHGQTVLDSPYEEHKGLDDTDLPSYDDPEVKRILRKVDWRLPPVLAVLYLFSFLDRSNSEIS